MTIGNDASKGAELLQQGIRQVREGRTQDAYAVFRDAVSYDPGNEFGWIWLSITSPDRAEKRSALEQALEINPNSSHARQALKALDAENVRETPPHTTDTAITDSFKTPPSAPNPEPTKRGLKARIGSSSTTPASEENLAQNLRETPKNKTRGNSRQVAPVGTMVGTRSVGQSFARIVRRVLLVVVVLIVIGLAVALVYTNFINKPTPLANIPVPSETTVNSTATTSAATVSGLNSNPITTDAITVAPTNEVATALVPTPTPQTALLTTPAATSTPGLTPVGDQVTKLISDAQNSLSNNDYKTVIQDYKQALTLDPTNLQANLKLGLAYLTAPDSLLDAQERYDGAIAAFRTVTDLAPTWPGGFAQLGAAYAAKGDLQNAIKAYRSSLDLDPNGPERWLALALLYDRNNQPAEANYARSRAQGLIVATPATTSTNNPATSTTISPATTGNTTQTATLAVTTENRTTLPVTAAPTATPVKK